VEGELTSLRQTKVLRVLEGVSYWVMENPREIAELMNTNVRKEWESDMAEHEDQQDRAWLKSLPRRSWRLEKMKLADIKLNSQIMEYSDGRTGYVFRTELERRVKTMRKSVERVGVVIWPLVVRAEDNQLTDGYCRYHVLKDLGVRKTYAYVGSGSGQAI
jgi:hypothetical protein